MTILISWIIGIIFSFPLNKWNPMYFSILTIDDFMICTNLYCGCNPLLKSNAQNTVAWWDTLNSMGVYKSFLGTQLFSLYCRWLGVLGWITADSWGGLRSLWQYTYTRTDNKTAPRKQHAPVSTKWNRENPAEDQNRKKCYTRVIRHIKTRTLVDDVRFTATVCAPLLSLWQH